MPSAPPRASSSSTPQPQWDARSNAATQTARVQKGVLASGAGEAGASPSRAVFARPNAAWGQPLPVGTCSASPGPLQQARRPSRVHTGLLPGSVSEAATWLGRP